MALKYINIFPPKAPKICPNLDFWFEKKPSGSPARNPRSRQSGRESIARLKIFFPI
jgi:hypothetical protein